MENNKKNNILNIIAIILIALLSAGVGSLITYNIMVNQMKNEKFDPKQMEQKFDMKNFNKDDFDGQTPPNMPEGMELPEGFDKSKIPSDGEQSFDRKQNKSNKQDKQEQNQETKTSEASSI